MSLAEVERFSRDLKSDSTLLGEATKNPVQAVLEVAAQRGYSFTVEEAKVFIRSKAQMSGRELSDSELDGVTGGFTPHREAIHLFL